MSFAILPYTNCVTRIRLGGSSTVVTLLKILRKLPRNSPNAAALTRFALFTTRVEWFLPHANRTQ